jgi:uncharacterized protein YbaP (TraB family)
MIMALICREMKWDYHTYQRQPAWFIDLLIMMLQAEAEGIERQTKKFD